MQAVIMDRCRTSGLSTFGTPGFDQQLLPTQWTLNCQPFAHPQTSPPVVSESAASTSIFTPTCSPHHYMYPAAPFQPSQVALQSIDEMYPMLVPPYGSCNTLPHKNVMKGANSCHDQGRMLVGRSLSYPEPNDKEVFLEQTGPYMSQKLSKSDETFSRYKSPHISIDYDTDSSDDDSGQTHPNKFPVSIEEHRRPECGYKRQPNRSGSYVKVTRDNGETLNLKQKVDEMSNIEYTNGISEQPPQVVRYYRKDLVRVCRCGNYSTLEHMLRNAGRTNDADGYEVHYSKKCRWKSYEDFKTKKRVLIRLCKCYKPSY